MNLLRKKSWNFLAFYASIPKNNFASLSSEAKYKLEMIKDTKRYYDELLKEAPVTERGKLKADPDHVSQLLSRVQTPEDVKIVLSAYYNFLGHGYAFKYSLVDRIIRKAIEMNDPQSVHEVILNHNYLQYYPHPNLLDEMIENHRTNKQVDQVKALFKSLKAQRNLLKFNPRFFEEAIILANEAQDSELAFLVFDVCLDKGMTFGKEMFPTLLDSLYNLGLNPPAEQKGRHPTVGRIIKSAKSQKLRIEDWLKLSLSQTNNLEDAISLFENLVSTETDLAEDTTFTNTGITQEYFTKMFDVLETRPKYFKRFVNALKSIQNKYTVDKELGDFIESSVKRIKASNATRGKAEAITEDENKEVSEEAPESQEKKVNEP